MIQSGHSLQHSELDSRTIPVLFCRGAALNVLEILNRMGGRVVEGTGLENRQARKRLVGSNPTPSAIYFFNPMITRNKIGAKAPFPLFHPQIELT